MPECRPQKTMVSALMAIAILSAYPADPAVALPKQAPEEVVKDANSKGWRIDSKDFQPGRYYGFSKEGDWKRIGGRTVYEGRSFRFGLDDEVRIVSEVLDYWADVAYVDGNITEADTYWKEYVEEFYGPEIAREILEAQPLRRIVATTGTARNIREKLSVVVGKEWVYKTIIKARYTDASLRVLRPESRLEYEVHVLPKTFLKKSLRDLESYNLITEDYRSPAFKDTRP